MGSVEVDPAFGQSSGEELVPISGRPPSLINRPSGCHFHPRCPYVQEAHRRVDPPLSSIDRAGSHAVACLLGAPVREQIWQGLREGRDPEALKRIAASANGAGVPQRPEEPAA